MSLDQQEPASERFLTMIRQQKRGRLKIYLGFAAGVGKTYEMLQEAHRLNRQGVDVVIGIVETHGRAETDDQIGDLEQVPRRKIEYRGVILEEMDLDAVFARHPGVALVDELAHTNAPAAATPSVTRTSRSCSAPASTSSARSTSSTWKACTTSSRQATGVKVKERIPDYVLGMADQLVNVDVSAEDLRERLEAGKIYPAERIDTALESFFTHANLTRLRELAFEEIAYRLDRRQTEAKQNQEHSTVGPRDGLPQFPQSQRRAFAAPGGPAGRSA